ncbi:MAG: ATP-binding protein [Patescibacteria group bacterium]
MALYSRILENKIKEKLFQGKVLCLFGPRRSGKTTLARKILSEFGESGYYLNCEDARERNYLIPGDPHVLKTYLGKHTIAVLDEAQTIENIGLVLKVFVDTYPDVQLIATGSSSFELANRLGEPLLGRAWDFFLSPLSFAEIFPPQNGLSRVEGSLVELLIYGSFPQVVVAPVNEKIQMISQIANNYLYKDIFTFESIRKPKILENLLKSVALQLGQEVSLNELSRHIGVGRQTIERYLSLLEKSFVIKRLYSLRRNRRDEIKSNFKIYFYDLGVRNYIINAFNPIDIRADVGGLFENYFIMERVKYHYNHTGYLPNVYFWRTHGQKEIDFIEEQNGVMSAFECKWTKENVSFKEFLSSYPGSQTHVVHRGNIQEFLW